MNAPTDTFIQVLAQAMGGDGVAVGLLFLFAILVTLAVVGTIGTVLEARDRRRHQMQIDLERSERRARGL